MSGRPKLPDGEKSFLLDGELGWRGASYSGQPPQPIPPQGVAVGANLRLAAHPDGPLALESADGSLGRLLLPRGTAFDGAWTLFMLMFEGDKAHTIQRFDAVQGRFVALPGVGGRATPPHAADGRQFIQPAQIAIAGTNLYVADPEAHRVQVFDLVTLALRYVWDDRDWLPQDVAASRQSAYILDRANGRVYRHRPGIDRLQKIVDLSERKQCWTRVAVDRHERLYLYNSVRHALEIFAEAVRGRWVFQREVDDAGDVRESFDPPAITLDAKGRFCLPASLRAELGRKLQIPPRNCCYFDRTTAEVARVEPGEPMGSPLYERAGTWTSTRLDSEIYRCQWHRLVIDIAHLPPGSRIEVLAFTSGDTHYDHEVVVLPDEDWQRALVVDGRMQADALASGAQQANCLVQSREGQHFWLRVRLMGDGYDTPEVSAMRIYYPRDSYVKYLPAVFVQDEESRWFLERFLSITQTEWDDLERRIRNSAAYFDPRAVPAGDAMRYLAGWIGLPLEGMWTDEQNRRLLTAMPALLKQRGTLGGLQRFLRVYLANLSGVDEGDQAQIGMPMLLEGYRERNHTLLDDSQEAQALEGHALLWSDSVSDRFQLDVHSTEGDARLVSVGDPDLDLFATYANRFRVYIPAAWVRSADDERILRRALDGEKPAHTDYDLHLVEPRFRIGIQARLGVDAIIGALPAPTTLQREPGKEPDAPLFGEPRGRLGYDTILGGDEPTAQQRRTPRLGLDTRLS
jgi:phage tail-like protein